MPESVPCLVCGGATASLAKLPPLPTASNRLAASEAEAREAPRGILDLVSCGSCGHVFNRAFEPRLVPYDEGYDTALHFSAHYRSYAAATAARLRRNYHLYGRRIVEIGCGDGEFLDLQIRIRRQKSEGAGHGVKQLHVLPSYDQGARAVAETARGEVPAAHAELEGFFAQLAQTLDAIDFHKGRAPESAMRKLRRLFLRADLDVREVRLLRGILADAQRMARLAREPARAQSQNGD